MERWYLEVPESAYDYRIVESERSQPMPGWPPGTDEGRGSLPSILDTFAMVLTEKKRDAPLDGTSYGVLVPVTDDPRSMKEALSAPDARHWIKAIHEEWTRLQEMKTFTIEKDTSRQRPIIPCKWVFRKKIQVDGTVRYKARLVICGNFQTEDTYSETFAPTASLITFCFLIALAAFFHWSLRHVDVMTAFLYGDLDEEVYMRPPPGC